MIYGSITGTSVENQNVYDLIIEAEKNVEKPNIINGCALSDLAITTTAGTKFRLRTGGQWIEIPDNGKFVVSEYYYRTAIKHLEFQNTGVQYTVYYSV